MQVILSALSTMAPLLLAALGGLFSALSGTLNIALEGMLTIGAFSSIAFASATGSLALGILIGMIITTALSALLGLFTIRFKANPFIAGLAANLLAGGVCTVTSGKIYATEGVVNFASLPKLASWHGLDIFLPIALAGTLICAFVIRRTSYGLHLRACGRNQEAISSLGLRADFYNLTSFLISGAFCSVAGAAIMFRLGAYVPNASSGKGWIALVIVYLGNMRPLGLLAAALVFALADSFSNFAQGFWNVPADFILAIPYVFTLAAMIIFSIFSRKRKSFM